MSFSNRAQQATTVVQTVTEKLWKNAEVAARYKHVPFGYETHIEADVREALRFARSATARHIRFAPDFFVVDLKNPENVFMLEYKSSQTPIASPRRVEEVRRASGRSNLTPDVIGQWEQLAHDNYLALANLGVKVAILYYCAYYQHMLTCEFADRVQVLMQAKVTSPTKTGSGTPFVNIYIPSMRAIEQFLSEELQLIPVMVDQITAEMRTVLQQQLPVKDWYRRSPCNSA